MVAAKRLFLFFFHKYSKNWELCVLSFLKPKILSLEGKPGALSLFSKTGSRSYKRPTHFVQLVYISLGFCCYVYILGPGRRGCGHWLNCLKDKRAWPGPTRPAQIRTRDLCGRGRFAPVYGRKKGALQNAFCNAPLFGDFCKRKGWAQLSRFSASAGRRKACPGHDSSST